MKPIRISPNPILEQDSLSINSRRRRCDESALPAAATPSLAKFPPQFECPVCLDLLCYATRCLPCGHVFCSPCLRSVNKAAQSVMPDEGVDLLRAALCGGNIVLCPLCRVEIAATVPCEGEYLLHCQVIRICLLYVVGFRFEKPM